jgi:DNA-binding winged helix-turn-helix (wHTH) protein/TolB-like protein
MLASPSRVLRFDKFTLEPARCALLRGNEELALRRQSFDVLRYLAEHRGEIVSRDDLIKAVWAVPPARPEDSVFQCIKDIRRALGEDARWIVRTLPSRGYQFMAEVTTIEALPVPPGPRVEHGPSTEGAAASQARANIEGPKTEGGPSKAEAQALDWRRAPALASLLLTVLIGGGWLAWTWTRPVPPPTLTMMAVPTLAVLPFTAPDDQPDQGSEARALSDDVASEVMRHSLGHNLSLRSAVGYRGVATDIKAVGRQLGARYLLFGNVRQEGQVQVASVRLVEAETGRELLARPFRYALGERDLSAVRIAGSVNLLVVTSESRRPLPGVPEAAHYAVIAFAAMGNHRDFGDTQDILALFEKALALDPDWVPALVGYGWAQMVLGAWEPADRRAERLDKAQEVIERAIKLAPLNAMAYHHHALVLRARGDPVAAIAANQQALRLSPNLANAHAHLGLCKMEAGLAHQARAHIEVALRLSPGHRWQPLWSLWAGQAAVHTSDYHAAVEWLQKAAYARVPRRELKPWLAMAYAGLGREEEGSALIAEHLAEGHNLSIAGWRQRNPRGSGVLAEQRERIEGLLRRLGVPEGTVETSSAQEGGEFGNP